MDSSRSKLYKFLADKINRRLSTKVDQKSGNHIERRKNKFHISMIPENLRRILFNDEQEPEILGMDLSSAKKVIKSITKTKDFDGNADHQNPTSSTNPQVEMPKLRGRNIAEHFETIAEELLKNYRDLLKNFMAENWSMPVMPVKWSCKSGWTRYDPWTGSQEQVPFPAEDVLVFDVEICVSVSAHPVIATAVSKNAWYSWCSKRLDENYLERRVKNPFDDLVTVDDLIPIETASDGSHESTERKRERIIIGHNVGFDRTFLKEQYNIQGTKTRFFDTMSAHIAISGLAGDQRIEFQYHKTGRHTKAYADATGYDKRKKEISEEQRLFNESRWVNSTSMNNLADVHEFYCGGKSKLKISKDERETFVKGNLEDVASNFQDLVAYCARDTAATLEVYKVLMKLFFERFPSPITLFGMLEMSTTFLTVNDSWFHYLQSAEETFQFNEKRVKKLLVKQCDQSDLWMFDEDWSVQEASSLIKKSAKVSKKVARSDEVEVSSLWDECRTRLKKSLPFMIGFPLWYRNLCRDNRMKWNSDDDGNCTTQKFESWRNAAQHIHLIDGFDFGPSSISVQKQVTPKLLRLQWNNFPLYYSSKFGWGYLSPKSGAEMDDFDRMKESASVLKVLRNSTFYTLKFPLKALLQYILSKPHNSQSEERRICKMPGFEKLAIDYTKLPHKDGPENNVGNPLAKDFIHFINQNILSSENAFHAQLLAFLTLRCSYWKNNADRIQKLLLVLLPDTMLPDILRNNSKSVGIILPRMVVAGTVTRRAVESTWMTVSNAKKDRIGSELKAMIQAPDNYCFVGADVDSQELWIAGLLSDSSKYKVHGCTPFSFTLLKGTKADETDQHSVVAKSLGITRDQAKIINYGRFYGAGLNYAARLLQQFKPHENQFKIKSAAVNLYKFTKGVRENRTQRKNQKNNETSFKLMNHNSLWKNGSESELFNCLESIARSPKPETPVLKCRISRSLEPDVVGEKFLPSRINWIIQSSAVDFLHSLLTCMRWLCNEYNIDARFSISVHDEVRYLVKEEDKYKAALALQISNLLTRAFFVHSSVAYFSQVDIDKTIRKESNDDCVTPSNPLGLETCYNIPKGESLNIRQLLSKLERI